MLALRFVVFIFLFLLISSKSIFAATVEFSNTQSSFQKEQEAILDIKVSGAAANTSNYLRAAFYPDSTTSYFGYTYNHLSEWYNGASPIDPKKFLQIQISGEGTWSGQLKIKPDISSPYFKGNGSYLLKVGRYTANGTSVTDWSSSIEVTIMGIDPTSTPTPTSAPTNTPTPTNKLTPTPTKTPIPTQKPTGSISGIQKSATESSQALLGESSESAENEIVTPSPTPITKVLSSQFSKTPFLLIIGGVLIFIICGILSYLKFKGKMPFFTAENDI